MRSTAGHIPDHWLFLPIKRGNVRLASFFGLMDSSSEAAPISSPMTVDSWISAATGDASGFWFQSLAVDLIFPDVEVWGDVAAVSRADVGFARRSYSARTHGRSILGDAGTDFLWGGGRLVDAWPSNADDDRYSHVQDSKVPTLLIGGALDVATPAQDATREVLPHLPNGHQVVLSQLGHTTDFWSYEPRASSRLVNAFFESGVVDKSLYTQRTVDFTPGVGQTALAKYVAGSMVGLAILTVLSLLLIWRRLRTRGQFGRTAAALLRSLYAPVLGLGGWLLGALVIFSSRMTIPLDDTVLVVLSGGIPVGLTIYAAWVRRDVPASTRAAGFACAIGGALAGAWLGLGVAPGILAILTAIAGATAGANLTLIVFDIARERAVRVRQVTAVAWPARSVDVPS